MKPADMREYSLRKNECQFTISTTGVGLGVCRKPLAAMMTSVHSANQPCCEYHAQRFERFGWKRKPLPPKADSGYLPILD